MNKIELIKSIRTATFCSLEQAKPLANLIWELSEGQERLETRTVKLQPPEGCIPVYVVK